MKGILNQKNCSTFSKVTGKKTLLIDLKVSFSVLCTCPTHQLWQVKYIRHRGADPQSAGQAVHLSRVSSHLCLFLLSQRSALLPRN